jgi:hypothetical protein
LRANLLIFDGPPEPLNEDAVPPGPFVIHAPFSCIFNALPGNGQVMSRVGREGVMVAMSIAQT